MAQSYDRFKKFLPLCLLAVSLLLGASVLFANAAPVGGGALLPPVDDAPPPAPLLAPGPGLLPPPILSVVPEPPAITGNTRALTSCIVNFEWRQDGPGARAFEYGWSVDNFISSAGTGRIPEAGLFIPPGDPDLTGIFSAPLTTGLIPSNSYWYRVRSCSDSGCSAYVKTNPAVTTSPLPVPSTIPTITSIQGSRGSTGQDIFIQWTAAVGSVSDFGGFSIERSKNGGTFSPIGYSPFKVGGVPQPLSYTNINVPEDGYYTYRIRAYDTAEGCSPVDPLRPSHPSTNLVTYSGYSNLLIVPITPSNLSVGATESTAVINWLDNSTNESSFVIERSIYSDFPSVGTATYTVPANTTTYTDSDVRIGRYYYRVKACSTPTSCSRFTSSELIEFGDIKPELTARIIYVSTSTARASVLFSWKGIEAVPVDVYTLEESTSASFDNPVKISDFSSGGSSNFLYQDQPLRQMYYRMVAYFEDDLGNLSEWYSDVVPMNLAITNVISGQAWSAFRLGAPVDDRHGVGFINFNVDSEVDPQRQVPPGRIEYSVQADNAGLVSGLAWATAPPGPTGIRNGTGWITFNKADLAGCPTAPCEARFSKTANRMWGWARFYSSNIAFSDNPSLPVTSGWVYLGPPAGALALSPMPVVPSEARSAPSVLASLFDVRGTFSSVASLIRSVFGAVGPVPAPAAFDFTISAQNRSGIQGGSVSNSIVASRTAGNPPIDGPVAVFSATNLPVGVTASFSPTGCLPTCSTTMNINIGAAVAPGVYTVGVSGTYNTTVRTTTFSLTVVEPAGGGGAGAFDFSLSATGRSVIQGSSVTAPIVASGSGSPVAPVTFSVSGFPVGVTGTFVSSSCTPTCTVSLSINAALAVPPANYPITVTGVSGSITKTATFQLTVVLASGGGGGIAGPFNFSLSASGRTVIQGSSVTNPIVASRSAGTGERVVFSVSGLPSGVTGAFSPAGGCIATCVAVLTVTTSPTATLGTHAITVTGTSPTVTKTVIFNLVIVGSAAGGEGGSPDVNIAYDTPTKTLVGAAWGGNVLGWLAFSKTECNGLCTVRVEETTPSAVLPVENVLIQEGAFIESGLSGPVWCSWTPYYNLYWDYNGPVPLAQADIAIVTNSGVVHYQRTLLPSDLESSAGVNGTRYKYEFNDPLGYTDTGAYGGGAYLDPSTVYRLRVRVQDESGTWTHVSSDSSTWASSPDTATPAHYAPFVDTKWSPQPIVAGSPASFTGRDTIDRSLGGSPASGWSWRWTFTGGSPSTATTRDATTVYGTDPISLTVMDPVIANSCKFTTSPIAECVNPADCPPPDTERIKRRVIRER